MLPKLGAKQVLFLQALVELRERAYGMSIAEWFEAVIEKRVNVAQVYSIAGGLERDAIVTSTTEPNPNGKGREVVVYRMTPFGEKLYALVVERVRSGALD